MKLYDLYVNTNTLYVFDFDDTVATSSARVHITGNDGHKSSFTSQEFINHKFNANVNRYDFSEFENTCNAKANPRILKILQSVYNGWSGTGNVPVVLTARESPLGVYDFLDTHDLTGVQVYAIGPHASKAQWIKNRVLRDDFTSVVYYENSPQHIAEVEQLKNDPDMVGIEIIIHQV